MYCTYVCISVRKERAIIFMYMNDDVKIGNRGIREDIERDETRKDNGNRRKTQNANIKIYTGVT